MLVIKDSSTVPPENWIYEVAGDSRGIPAFTVSTKNYQLLYSLVADYCNANRLPVPSQQDVIDQICARLHVPCYEKADAGNTPLINKMGLPFVKPPSSCCQSLPQFPVSEENI